VVRVERDVRRRHASSFSAAAAAYAEHRPDYAPAAVGWALEAAPGPRVLDLGAGTCKLAGMLVADVVAVEPDPAMLVMPEPERQATLGRIRAFLASRPETASGEFTLPMLTGILRVR
jgi:hypothetical protein